MRPAVVAALLLLAACGDAGRFDAEVWRAQRGSGAAENPRAGMTADLRPRLTAGMSRAEVEALLGPPEFEQSGVAAYAIGAAGYGVDFEHFTVHYDAAGRLVRTGLERG